MVANIKNGGQTCCTHTHTHTPVSRKNSKNWFWYITMVFKKYEKFKTKKENHKVFGGSFMKLKHIYNEIIITNGSLILIFFKILELIII